MTRDANGQAFHKAAGLSLALTSALFIGSSFVIKKKGLLQSLLDDNNTHGYLKNPLWWTGMILMLLGEVCNLVAYAFSPAILVAPLGALSVVISAFLSSWFLKERLSFSGKVGCFICVLGATIVALYGPTTSSTDTIPEFLDYALAPGFLAFACISLVILLVLIFWAAPRYGNRSPMVYICICSFTGAFVVIATQGLGSAIVYSISNPSDSQFTHWFLYVLIAFVAMSGIVQINYLNKALNLFSTAIVTPIYYVLFTSLTLLCSGILFNVSAITTVLNFVTLLIGFLVIVSGVALLYGYSLKLSRLQQQSRQRRQDLLDETLLMNHCTIRTI